MNAYAAADAAGRLRDAMIARGESFVFETVLSDPEGEKVRFLSKTAARGYTVVLCFIGLQTATLSTNRVAMRVTKGGHDVPTEKLVSRFPRILANLARARVALPHVLIFDNTLLTQPDRFVAEYQNGMLVKSGEILPEWFERLREPESPTD